MTAPSTLAAAAPGSGARTQAFFASFLWLALALSAFVPVDPAPIDLFLLASIPLVLALAGKRLLFDVRFQSVLLLLALYLVANGLASTEALDAGVAAFFVGVTGYLALSFVALAVLFYEKGERLVRAGLNGYLLSALVSCVLGCLAFFGLNLVPWDLLMFGRIVAFFKDPNVFAPYLVPVGLYALDRYRSEPRSLRRAGWMVAFCVLNATVLLCFSRAAWANDALALAVYLVLLPPRLASLVRRRNLLAAGAIVLACGAAAWLLVSSSAVSDLLFARLAPQAYDDDRFGTQRLAFETLLGSPLGIGPGQSELRFDYATHSLYVRLLVETGWAGAASMVGLLGLTLFRAVRLARRGTAEGRRLYAIAAAALAGIVVNSAVVDTLHWRHLWLVLAIAWGRYGQRLPASVSCAPEAPSRRTMPSLEPRQSLPTTVV